VERFENCYKKLKLESFILVGHSFGAYVSSLFSLRHPEMIERLILLSPVGISSNYCEIISTKLEDLLQNVFWQMKKPPASAYQMFGGLAHILFNKICDKKKIKGLNDEEFIVYKDFQNVLMRNKSSSEKAIFNFFDKNLRAFKPLTFYYDIIQDLRILVLYGDVDWCPVKQSMDLKDLSPDNIEIGIVSDSGHLLYTDNHKELCDKILSYLTKEGLIECDEFGVNSLSSTDVEDELKI